MNGYSLYCPYNGPNLAKARRLVAESGTKGQPVTIWIHDFPPGHRNAAYLVSVLQSIGYKARVEFVPHDGRTYLASRPPGGRRRQLLDRRLPVRQRCLPPVPLQLLHDRSRDQPNPAGICDRRLDAQVARARSLETTNPAAAAGAWHSIDRMLTDEAPFVPMKVFLSTDFVARRVGNYRYCWLSGSSGLTGACLDQLWVR